MLLFVCSFFFAEELRMKGLGCTTSMVVLYVVLTLVIGCGLGTLIGAGPGGSFASWTLAVFIFTVGAGSTLGATFFGLALLGLIIDGMRN
jgi:hypothetical protein